MVNIIDLTSKKELKKYYKDIKKYYRKVIETLELDDVFEASLIIVGKNKIRTINKKYRNIDKETDVISFAEIDSKDDYFDNYLGDIFINVDKVKSQAEEYNHSLKREFCFLFVHGMLHLFGYDHMKKSDEKKMFLLQEIIIGDLK